MTNVGIAKELVKLIEPIIGDYVRVKIKLNKRISTPEERAVIAIEAFPRFVDLVLDKEDFGLREPVGDEVRRLIISKLEEEGKYMISEKKLRANNENSKLGGVKTPEGKLISKNNSLKHGILAQGEVPGDSISVLDIYEQFHREFKPESPSREILVQQLALTVVRLIRCSDMEVEIYKDHSLFQSSVSMTLNHLATLSERYESRLVNRMLRLIDVLKGKG